ncbi:MAG: pentapeptide repeat-containing protein [Bdellovibrionales bacterium]|nr:pentapeptide repeat-containing protein [Bdellovibrionales bacterium]
MREFFKKMMILNLFFVFSCKQEEEQKNTLKSIDTKTVQTEEDSSKEEEFNSYETSECNSSNYAVYIQNTKESLEKREELRRYSCGQDCLGKVCQLEEMNFKNKDLSNFTFDYANLRNSDFTLATLEKSSFEGADLTEVTFEKAGFKSSFFEEAVLTRAIFSGAMFRESDFLEDKTSFKSADLIKANFTDAELIDISFEKADLTEANFTKAKLTNVSFEGAILTGAVFTDAELIDISFEKADLTRADLRTFLDESYFQGAVLNEALYVRKLNEEGKGWFSWLNPKGLNESQREVMIDQPLKQ